MIAEPTAGLIKSAAFTEEYNNPWLFVSDFWHETQEHGLIDGFTEVVKDRVDLVAQFVKSDTDVQSYVFLLGLALIAFIPVIGLFAASLIGGSILAAQTINFMAGVDRAIQLAATRAEAMKIASSAEVRRQVLLNIVLAVFTVVGLSKGVKEINAFLEFREAMPISFQSELSIFRQTEIFNTARNLGVSPDVVQFYMDHITSGDSRLAGLSTMEGLRVSDLAVRSGNSAFVLDYISRYGADTAIKSASPEGLAFYTEQSKIPGSRLSSLTTWEGMTLSELSPQSIAKVTGLETPKIPKGITPDVNTPVLNLTQQEISVLAKLSTKNPNAEYAVLGLWKNGQGYTMLGSEGYTYLDMPQALYADFFRKYPGDFRVLNEQYLIDLARENKQIVLETSYIELRTNNPGSAAYWEIQTLIEKYGYTIQEGLGPNGYQVLVPAVP